jgi:hypothetical protein
MKTKTVLSVVLSILAVSATAQVHVRGYVKKDGTYVAPHERTAPNQTTLDNYSTKGNINPYTGQEGTKDPGPTSYQIQPLQPIQPVQPVQPVQAIKPIQPIQPVKPLQSTFGSPSTGRF